MSFPIFASPPLEKTWKDVEKDAELRILTSGLLFAMGLASGAEVRCTASLARLSLRPMADGEESFRKERKERRESAQSRGSTKESTCPCGDSQRSLPIRLRLAPCVCLEGAFQRWFSAFKSTIRTIVPKWLRKRRSWSWRVTKRAYDINTVFMAKKWVRFHPLTAPSPFLPLQESVLTRCFSMMIFGV